MHVIKTKDGFGHLQQMTIKDIQEVSLEILKDVHDFCMANDIRYTLQGGTLLGAIRHQGFIPWDDDIDIAMPRPDYERFIRSYHSEKGYKAFSRELPSPAPEVYLAFSRVCDMERTFVDYRNLEWTSAQTGVWIDVFPLDGIQNDGTERNEHFERMYELWRKYHSLRFANRPFSWNRKLKTKNVWFITQFRRPFLSYKMIDEHIKLCQSVKYGETDSYIQAAFMGYGMKEVHRVNVLGETVLKKFEGYDFCVMAGYDEALREKYGNYMKLPPVEQRVNHHGGRYYWKDQK